MTKDILLKRKNKQPKKKTLQYEKFTNNIHAPHFVLYIKDLLIAQYGEKMVEEGGLKVTTSLDLRRSKLCPEMRSPMKSMRYLTYYHVTNGAALVTDPANGEILAMVGSKNYFDTHNCRKC